MDLVFLKRKIYKIGEIKAIVEINRKGATNQ
jgi:hypothetical protein